MLVHQTFQVSYPRLWHHTPATASQFPLTMLNSLVSNSKLCEALEFLITIFVLTLQNDTTPSELRISQTVLAETCQAG